MALKSLIHLGQPEQRLAVYTVTSPAVCPAFLPDLLSTVIQCFAGQLSRVNRQGTAGDVTM